MSNNKNRSWKAVLKSPAHRHILDCNLRPTPPPTILSFIIRGAGKAPVSPSLDRSPGIFLLLSQARWAHPYGNRQDFRCRHHGRAEGGASSAAGGSMLIHLQWKLPLFLLCSPSRLDIGVWRPAHTKDFPSWLGVASQPALPTHSPQHLVGRN